RAEVAGRDLFVIDALRIHHVGVILNGEAAVQARPDKRINHSHGSIGNARQLLDALSNLVAQGESRSTSVFAVRNIEAQGEQIVRAEAGIRAAQTPEALD